MILRECAAAGAQPWYPADYARATGLPRDTLDPALDELRVGGLIRLTDWVQGKGQGYALTSQGEKVLERPRLLSRLRSGVVPRAAAEEPAVMSAEQPDSFRRTRAIRDALVTDRPPRATLALIGANVLVFLVGMALAQHQGVLTAYLSTPFGEIPAQERPQFERVRHIQHELGSLTRADLLAGSGWWRLLVTCFLHGGLLHLGMNMYALYVLGPLLERMWGTWRFFIVYLIAGLTGSCAAMVFATNKFQPVIGASGAICGILGSMATWVYLNRPYLPRDIAANWMRGILTNVVLIVFISLVPNVSASGHFGGGVGGLVAAVPMVYNRFGTPVQRWLGLAGVLIVPLLAIGWVMHSFTEVEKAQAQCIPTLGAAESLDKEVLDQHFTPMCKELDAGKSVPEAQIESARVFSARAQDQLEALAGDLPAADSFSDDSVRAAVEHAHDYVNAVRKFVKEFHRSLMNRTTWGRNEALAVRSWRGAVNRYHERVIDSVLLPRKN
jgi:membrane associated rhomboid family serine protease